jgi:hypothetical protein
MKRSFAVRCLLLFALFNLMLLFTGCTDAWVSSANGIISALIPAINAALAILAAFGVGVSPTALAAIQAWGTDAQDTLTNVVKPAIDAYNTAAASVQATLLTQIDAALNSIVSNLNTALAAVHVTDPASQAKITAIFAVIQAFMVSLINLIPVLQGTVKDAARVHELIHAVKPEKEFRKEFNALAGQYGKEYTI